MGGKEEGRKEERKQQIDTLILTERQCVRVALSFVSHAYAQVFIACVLHRPALHCAAPHCAAGAAALTIPS